MLSGAWGTLLKPVTSSTPLIGAGGKKRSATAATPATGTKQVDHRPT